MTHDFSATSLRSCPNTAAHTYGPTAYLAWHEWAERMSKTHDFSKCPGCGLYLIVTKKATDD